MKAKWMNRLLFILRENGITTELRKNTRRRDARVYFRNDVCRKRMFAWHRSNRIDGWRSQTSSMSNSLEKKGHTLPLVTIWYIVTESSGNKPLYVQNKTINRMWGWKKTHKQIEFIQGQIRTEKIFFFSSFYMWLEWQTSWFYLIAIFIETNVYTILIFKRNV